MLQRTRSRFLPILSSAALLGAVFLASCISSSATGTDPVTVATIAAVSGTGQTAVVRTTLAKPFVVKLSNQFGTGISGVTVTWSIFSGDGTLGQNSGATDADGTASITYTAGTSVGTSTITANAAGLAPVVFNVTVKAAP